MLQVKVKKRGDDQKFIAKVLTIGVDCDIALLAVEDEAFWQGVTPLEFGPLPRLQDDVAVVGYPIGGDTISVTAGVVSRIEVSSAARLLQERDDASSCVLLLLQLTAESSVVLTTHIQCCGRVSMCHHSST